jgi:hypothetical protein
MMSLLCFHSPACSAGNRTEYTRAAIISVESDYSQAARSWQWRFAFEIYCAALFICFVVTMGMHPGITSFICSTENPAKVGWTGATECMRHCAWIPDMFCISFSPYIANTLQQNYKVPSPFSCRFLPVLQALHLAASLATCLFLCFTFFLAWVTSWADCCQAMGLGLMEHLHPSLYWPIRCSGKWRKCHELMMHF